MNTADVIVALLQVGHGRLTRAIPEDVSRDLCVTIVKSRLLFCPSLRNANVMTPYIPSSWCVYAPSYVMYLLFFFVILSGVRLSPLGTAATIGLMYQPQMIDDGVCGAIGGMKIGRRNRSTRREPAPIATLPTTNPTWPDPCSNPGRRGGKPATNRLSYVTA
jgi:hypothetical protein